MQANIVTTRVHAPTPQILRPEDMPDRYELTIAGACCEPAFKDGSLIEVSRSEKAQPGDFIVLFLDPAKLKPGVSQVQLKRLVLGVPQTFWDDPGTWAERSNIAPMMLVEMLNPARTLSIKPSILLGYHKVIGVLPEARARRGWQA